MIMTVSIFPRSKNIYMSISAAVYTGTELSKQGANHPSPIVTSGYCGRAVSTWPQGPKLLFVNCKWKLNRQNLTCFVLFLNLLWKLFYDAQVAALTVVDFTMLYVRVWLSFHCWCHAPFVIIVSRFVVGY